MPAQSEEKDPTVETAEPGANGEVSSNEEVPASGAAAAGDPVAEAKAEAARMKDQWMRTAADFDNFRKRSRRELEDTRKAGKEDLLKEFLPVFDNLERAIHSASRATEVKAVAEGLQMVLRQYLETLSRGGIDPTYHEAIQQLETDEQPAGTVVAEVQPGYMQGDRLIRAAMVVVAKPKPTGDGASGGEATSSE